MNDDLTKKVLVRTAELVERGWCQYVLGLRTPERPESFSALFTHFTHAGRIAIMSPALLEKAELLCLDGALLLATHEVTGIALDVVAWSQTYQDAQYALHAKLQPSAVSYVMWNDAVLRTQDEVVALCRAAAE